jgi:hypothetical protein
MFLHILVPNGKDEVEEEEDHEDEQEVFSLYSFLICDVGLLVFDYKRYAAIEFSENLSWHRDPRATFTHNCCAFTGTLPISCLIGFIFTDTYVLSFL